MNDPHSHPPPPRRPAAEFLRKFPDQPLKTKKITIKPHKEKKNNKPPLLLLTNFAPLVDPPQIHSPKLF